MSDCLFCKIARKEIPARLVYEDEDAVAFEDINPQAPVHVLVVPKRHIPTLNELTPADDALLGKLARISAGIARDRGVSEAGWRSVVNVNREGGHWSSTSTCTAWAGARCSGHPASPSPVKGSRRSFRAAVRLEAGGGHLGSKVLHAAPAREQPDTPLPGGDRPPT